MPKRKTIDTTGRYHSAVVCYEGLGYLSASNLRMNVIPMLYFSYSHNFYW